MTNNQSPITNHSLQICYFVFLKERGTKTIVSAKRLPETTAYVRITGQSWQQGNIEGEVRAGAYEWQFQWSFRRGKLIVQPSLGRALIIEPLSRFLERWDYHLEAGGDYEFTVRAEL